MSRGTESFRHCSPIESSESHTISASTVGETGSAQIFGDLLKLARQADDQHHFMATIVCYRTPETRAVGMAQYRVYDIVDGQQRLTTLIILLKCIELAMAVDSPDRGELAKILVKRDGHLILLQTNNANERIFNRFIREGVIPSEDDAEAVNDIETPRSE